MRRERQIRTPQFLSVTYICSTNRIIEGAGTENQPTGRRYRACALRGTYGNWQSCLYAERSALLCCAYRSLPKQLLRLEIDSCKNTKGRLVTGDS